MSPDQDTQRPGLRLGTSVGLGLVSPQQLADVVDEVRRAAQLGLAGAWWNEVFSWDALTALAVAGARVPGIPLGTAVVTTPRRHPVTLASQALTAQAATGNRLTLGIGPSHRSIVESALGLAWDRPARRVRAYLEVLLPLLRGAPVEARNDFHRVAAQVAVPGAEPPPVLLAAHGPNMLRIAGELADGALATWTSPRVVADHIVPHLTAAAAGRPAPRVVVSLPVSVTDDPDGARDRVARQFGVANELPSYRFVLDLAGAAGVHETVIVGDEAAVAAELRRHAEAGTTELIAAPFGPPEAVARTLRLLAELTAPATGAAPRAATPAPAAPAP
ncbi:MAG TPA: TIGR03564 family F420-dependent LLM class oxidoreductase [Acidimicrobiales bacterium]